jgi:hypothetical protein
MSKSEKRYLKLYCSTEKGKKNYLLLFDEIEKQKTYNEEKLRKKFEGEKFLHQFSVLKNELYNKILFVLTTVSTSKTVNAQVKRVMLEAEVLQKKKLHNQAARRLQKAKSICEQHDLHEMLLEVLSLERKLVSESVAMMSNDELLQWYEGTYNVIAKLKNTFEYNYWVDYMNMNVLYPSKADPNYSEDVFTTILSSPLFTSEKNALSPFTRSIYHYMHMIHGYYSTDWEKCYLHSSQRLHLFETLEQLRASRPNGYASAIANHFVSCKNTKRWQEAKECISRLKAHPAASTDPITRAYIHSCTLSFYAFCQPAKLPAALRALEDDIEKLLAVIDSYNATVLLYVKAYAHFVSSDHRNALRTIAQVKGNSLSFREDIQLYVRLLELMIHYDKGNDDMLQPLVNSLYRFIRRRAVLTPFENELIGFFTNIYRNKEPFSMRAFYLRLEDLALEKGNLKVLEYIDIISWVKSKAQGRTMSEVIENNVRAEKENLPIYREALAC